MPDKALSYFGFVVNRGLYLGFASFRVIYRALAVAHNKEGHALCVYI